MSGNRVNKLRQELTRKRLDAFLVNKEANISYLSGFQGGESLLLVAHRDSFLITDARFTEQAEKEASGFRIVLSDKGLRYAKAAEVVRRLGVKRLGFESEWMAHKDFIKLKKLLKRVELASTAGVVEKLRAIKDEGEIDAIKKAARIAMDAFRFLRGEVRVGMAEQELAANVEYFMRRHGARRISFEPIVASGERSSMPHALTSARRVRRNESILVDIGASFEGYNSDLTRMIFLGKIPREIKKMYRIILRAQEKALSKIKPGKVISEIDRIARQHIAKEGFGKFFGHALGHGIGREVHEAPAICKRNRGSLKEGMVFTVEPAVYLPNKGGIRIEDMVLVTKTGCEVLTGDLDKSI